MQSPSGSASARKSILMMSSSDKSKAPSKADGDEGDDDILDQPVKFSTRSQPSGRGGRGVSTGKSNSVRKGSAATATATMASATASATSTAAMTSHTSSRGRLNDRIDSTKSYIDVENEKLASFRWVQDA